MTGQNRFCGKCGKIESNNEGEPVFKMCCGEYTLPFYPNRNPRFDINNEFIGFVSDSEELYKMHDGRMIEQFLCRGPFNNGYTLMIFEDLENDVKNFLSYVPIEYYPSKEERKKIYSPKLSNLLTIIVARIDEFFRSWDIVQKKNPNKKIEDYNLGNYFAIFNDLNLDNKGIVISSTGEYIKPLKRKKNTIEWWVGRNDVTHDGYNQRDKGNLDNVIMALGALLILNCEHKEVWRPLVRHNYIKRPSYFEPNQVNSSFMVNGPEVSSILFSYKSSIIINV